MLVSKGFLIKKGILKITFKIPFLILRYYSDVKPNDMKNRIFFLLLFFVCLEWNAYAVIDIQSIHITSSDGLANNTIRDIFQDKKGFIWISTTNGLSRYDGHSFITLIYKLRNQKHRKRNLAFCSFPFVVFAYP